MSASAGTTCEIDFLRCTIGPPMIDLDHETLAETAAFVAQVDAAAATLPPSHVLLVEEQRAAMASGAEPQVEHARSDEVAGVPVRVLEPALASS